MSNIPVKILGTRAYLPQQAIPTNAALIHEKLKLNDTTFAFDINATCLSFLTNFSNVYHFTPVKGGNGSSSKFRICSYFITPPWKHHF
jgi:hypothetical protein